MSQMKTDGIDCPDGLRVGFRQMFICVFCTPLLYPDKKRSHRYYL